MQNANKWMDLYGDENGPSIIIEFPDIYKNNYIEARRRGVKIRFITEITKENMRYCKEQIKIVDEFRHLEGFKSGIAVSESAVRYEILRPLCARFLCLVFVT